MLKEEVKVIEVLQSDIDAPGNPIANAVKRTFKAYQVFIGTRFIIYVPKRRQPEVVLELEGDAKDAQRMILKGWPISPFSFRVIPYTGSTTCEDKKISK